MSMNMVFVWDNLCLFIKNKTLGSLSAGPGFFTITFSLVLIVLPISQEIKKLHCGDFYNFIYCF